MNPREQKLDSDYIQEVVKQYQDFHRIPMEDFLERMQKGDSLAFNDLFRRMESKTLTKKDLHTLESFSKNKKIDEDLRNLLIGALQHNDDQYPEAIKSFEKVKKNPWKAFAATQSILVKFKEIKNKGSNYYKGYENPVGKNPILWYGGLLFTSLTYLATISRQEASIAKEAQKNLKEAGKIDPEALALLAYISNELGEREQAKAYCKEAIKKGSVTALDFGRHILEQPASNYAEAAKKGRVSALVHLSKNLDGQDNLRSLCLENAAAHNSQEAAEGLSSLREDWRNPTRQGNHLRDLALKDSKTIPNQWTDFHPPSHLEQTRQQYEKKLVELYLKNDTPALLYLFITSRRGQYDSLIYRMPWQDFTICLLGFDKNASNPNLVAAVEMFATCKMPQNHDDFIERDKILSWLVWQHIKNKDFDHALHLANRMISPSNFPQYNLEIGDQYCSGFSLGKKWDQEKMFRTAHSSLSLSMQKIRGLNFLLAGGMEGQRQAIRRICMEKGLSFEEPDVEKALELLDNAKNLLLANRQGYEKLCKDIMESKDDDRKNQISIVDTLIQVERELQPASERMEQAESKRANSISTFLNYDVRELYFPLLIKTLNQPQFLKNPTVPVEDFLNLYCNDFLQRFELEDKMKTMLNTSKNIDIATINEKNIDPKLKEIYEKQLKEDVDAIKIIKNAIKQKFKTPEEYIDYFSKHLAKNHHSLAVLSLMNFLKEVAHAPNAINHLAPPIPTTKEEKQKADAFFKPQKPDDVKTPSTNKAPEEHKPFSPKKAGFSDKKG